MVTFSRDTDAGCLYDEATMFGDTIKGTFLLYSFNSTAFPFRISDSVGWFYVLLAGKIICIYRHVIG